MDFRGLLGTLTTLQLNSPDSGGMPHHCLLCSRGKDGTITEDLLAERGVRGGFRKGDFLNSTIGLS